MATQPAGHRPAASAGPRHVVFGDFRLQAEAVQPGAAGGWISCPSSGCTWICRRSASAGSTAARSPDAEW